MAIKVNDAMPMHALFISANDEHGKEQLFLRAWDEQGGFFWLTGNPHTGEWVKLDEAQCDRLDPVMLAALNAATEEMNARAQAVQPDMPEEIAEQMKKILACNSLEELVGVLDEFGVEAPEGAVKQ